MLFPLFYRWQCRPLVHRKMCLQRTLFRASYLPLIGKCFERQPLAARPQRKTLSTQSSRAAATHVPQISVWPNPTRAPEETLSLFFKAPWPSRLQYRNWLFKEVKTYNNAYCLSYSFTRENPGHCQGHDYL